MQLESNLDSLIAGVSDLYPECRDDNFAYPHLGAPTLFCLARVFSPLLKVVGWELVEESLNYF